MQLRSGDRAGEEKAKERARKALQRLALGPNRPCSGHLKIRFRRWMMDTVMDDG